MADYRENVNRIVEVGWGSATLKVSAVNFGPSFNYIEFYEVDELGAKVTNDGTVFQGVMTGETSAASVDLSLLSPAAAAGASYLVVAAPSCAWAPGGFWNLSTGNASTSGEAPTSAGYISIAESVARVWSIPTSQSDEEEPPQCVTNSNGPALPAFIDGEAVTVSYP